MMTEIPTYVYGVATAGALRTPLRAQGMPDGQSPVTAIAVGGASAIVGRHAGPAISGLPRPELLRRLAIHQRVIEDALDRGDVLPAQFGTVLSSEAEVRMLLTGWGGLVRASLARFSGLVEVEVAATWDLPRVLGDVARDPAVMKAKSEAVQAPSDERLAQQVNVGKLVKEALDRRRARCQQMLLDAAGSLAECIQPNALLSDELVFNVAFLVRRSAMAEFETAIDRLDAELGGSCLLRIIGPLPPYTFGTVSITRFDAERLAAGRALLGLADEISEQAVLSSYRRLARQFHPDSQPACPDAAQRFAALNAARTDLLAYARGQGLGRRGRRAGADGDDRAGRTGRRRAGGPTMSPGTAVYLYGVVRDGDPLVLDVPPIGDAGPVYTLSHRGLAAVLSDDPLPRYEVTRKNVRGHQAVVDEVMRTTEILPTRLGTVLPSPQWVVGNFLEERWAELRRLLDRVAGRVEFGLKASWTDLQFVFAEVIAADRDLRAVRDRLTRRPAAATYEARLQLGERAGQALTAKRKQEADDLAGALEPHVVDIRRNDPVSELMVLNAAFLVDRPRIEPFEAAVQGLDRVHAGRLGFVLAGPLPPYNFVRLSGL